MEAGRDVGGERDTEGGQDCKEHEFKHISSAALTYVVAGGGSS